MNTVAKGRISQRELVRLASDEGQVVTCDRCDFALDRDGRCSECEAPSSSSQATLEARKGLGALTRSDALARIASHPPVWRVAGMISSDDYGVLAGPKGVGKTFALLDLGVSVALGEPWFGRFDTEQAKVLILTSEDSEARLWSRIDAITTSRGRSPEEVESLLHVHPAPFNAIGDLGQLRSELEAIEPDLVLLDPAYKYLVGAKPNMLFDMGGALTPLQARCTEAGAALLIGHHYNRREGVDREERISGAGLLEWSRVLITMVAPPRRGESPDVVATFEVSGNSIDPVVFRVRRRVEARGEGPNPPLVYSAEVIAEGEEARRARFRPAGERILATLPDSMEEALLVQEIGDRVAHDETGLGGIKHDNIRARLNDLRKDGKADAWGEQDQRRWWRT
jgi:hypothetical protein